MKTNTMRHLLLFLIGLISINVSAQHAEESNFLISELSEIQVGSPADNSINAENSEQKNREKLKIESTPNKDELLVNSLDEELNDSDKGMVGIFRVVGLACVTLVGCLAGVGGTIWLCIKGKKSIEQIAN